MALLAVGHLVVLRDEQSRHSRSLRSALVWVEPLLRPNIAHPAHPAAGPVLGRPAARAVVMAMITHAPVVEEGGHDDAEARDDGQRPESASRRDVQRQRGARPRYVGGQRDARSADDDDTSGHQRACVEGRRALPGWTPLGRGGRCVGGGRRQSGRCRLRPLSTELVTAAVCDVTVMAALQQ